MKPKSISSLKGHIFHIPRYQRGYRWDTEQVNMLLDDLWKFSKGKDKGKNNFYCLQPLVVVTIDKDKNEYEVVDGQQRLTTIYLIAKFLQSKSIGFTPYELLFDGRANQQKYIDQRIFQNDIEGEYKKNIENFYIYQAYQSIDNWFKNKFGTKNNDGTWSYDPFVLCKISSMFVSKDAAESGEKYVAVLWHEIADIKGDGALSAFRDLNYGKIPLTATENIKALLVQEDCYSENSSARILALQRVSAWERLSNGLQHKGLKGMIGDSKLDLLDVILDSIAEEINEEKKYGYTRKTSNKYSVDLFNYYVVDKFLNSAGDDDTSRSNAAEDVWERILNRANKLLNWYDHRNLYHLIGLYSLLSGNQGQKLIKEVEALEEFFDEKIQKKRNRTKLEIEEELRKMIGKIIKMEDFVEKNGEKPAEKQGLNHPELRYTERMAGHIRKILTAFNVYETMIDINENRYFPFHLFRDYNPTSLEHIHPKSIDDGSYKEYCSWWEVKKDTLSKEDNEKLNDLLSSEKTFKDDELKVKEIVKNNDAEFERKAGFFAPDEVHHIKNLALIDKDTNSALQFNTLNKKRDILIRIDKSGKTYIPAETHNVFAKKFSADQPGDMQYWLDNDRTQYLNAINKAYQYFTINI